MLKLCQSYSSTPHSKQGCHHIIGVGTGGAEVAWPPPICYPRDFINIHTCSADHHDYGVYYVRPPKMELLPTPMP